MSLLIVGSCSRVTQQIVLTLAKANIYQSIAIADLLPLYEHHYRYYRLRKHLNDQKSQTKVTLNKIVNLQQLSKQINQNQNILHVTHDYFTSVTSKNKLMQLTAELSKKKNNVLFAAPIEYDHYAATNPQQTFLNAKAKVLQTNPNASFIRSDVQDMTQLYAYIYKKKNLWEEKLLQTPNSFRPKVVSSSFFAQKVLQQLNTEAKGADLVVRGDRERHYTQVAHNKEVQDHETAHQVDNIRLLVTKYKGPEDKHSTFVVNKFQ